MRQLLPLATSVVTLIGMWMVGQKKAAGWAVGLANQLLWAAFIGWFQAWGLLPLCVALSYVYAKNLMAWRRDAHVHHWDDPVRPVTVSAEAHYDLAYRLRDERAKAAALEAERDDLRQQNTRLAMAIQLTQEYLGDDVLPPIPGWSWFDALVGTPFERAPRR